MNADAKRLAEWAEREHRKTVYVPDDVLAAARRILSGEGEADQSLVASAEVEALVRVTRNLLADRHNQANFPSKDASALCREHIVDHCESPWCRDAVAALAAVKRRGE